jgi:hypothetical protein
MTWINIRCSLLRDSLSCRGQMEPERLNVASASEGSRAHVSIEVARSALQLLVAACPFPLPRNSCRTMTKHLPPGQLEAGHEYINH